MEKITIEVIKEFINKEAGFNIEHKTGSYTKRRSDKVFLRWFLTYLSYKYSDEFVTNIKIGECLKLKPCTIVYGISEFEYLIKYDKVQSRNFKKLEDIFLERFKPKKQELFDLIETDKLKLIKNIKNLRLKVKGDKRKITVLNAKIEKLKQTY